MNPIVMPFLNNLAMTQAALLDCLEQTIPDLYVLLIDQGSADPTFAQQEAARDKRVLPWRHDPPLPSLSATWNRALQWAWESGAEHALVVNNDIRLHRDTYHALAGCLQYDAWFVSACGVLPEQFNPAEKLAFWNEVHSARQLGGPDFSCFLTTKECHTKYPFDEGYIPGYCEDLDYHRRMMLGGDGQRIFGVNIPFAHLGSGTLNDMTAEKRQAWEDRITQGSRAHHQRKWGGAANQEIYQRPFDETSRSQGVTTAALFQAEREKWANS